MMEEEEEDEESVLQERADRAVKSTKAQKAKQLREVSFDPQTFNPFDPENIKKDEGLKKKLL